MPIRSSGASKKRGFMTKTRWIILGVVVLLIVAVGGVPLVQLKRPELTDGVRRL